RRLHVAFDVADCGLLIGRELVLEGVLELLLPMRVWTEDETGDCFARRVQLEEFLGHVAHGLLDLGFRALPRRAAKAIDRRLARAGVFLYEIEALNRHEELVFARIPQLEKLLLVLADADLLQPDEYADAVIDMDHVVADFEVPKIGKERLRC